MSKRKTTTDKAIDSIEEKITEHQDAIKALQLAREFLVEQQRAQRGHPEGGKGI